ISCPFFFLFVIRCPTSITLFPYTTLFRSLNVYGSFRYGQREVTSFGQNNRLSGIQNPVLKETVSFGEVLMNSDKSCSIVVDLVRSEEHTSELQSRFELVCRLLLEKKNTTP